MRETSAREPAAGYADEAGPVDFVLEDSTSMLASVGSIDADNMALVNQTIDPFAPFEFTPPTAPGNSVQGQMFDNVHNTRVGDISLIGKDGDHPGQPVPSGSMDVLAGQFAIPETAEPRLNNRQVSEALMEILDRAEMPCPSDDSMAGWLAGTFNVGFDSALDPVLYAGITLRIVCLEGSVDFVVA